MLKMLIKLNNCIIKNRGLAIKCTGFLLCIGILAVCSSCGESPVLYDEILETETTMEVATEIMDNPEVYITEDDNSEAMMIVHLCGAVNNPGVYELNVDSRVIDGIVRAGGFTDDACEEALNLAMPISDGSKIYVPTEDEVSENLQGQDVSQTNTYIQNGDSAQMRSADDSDGLVNINTAGIERLMTLTGIGESRAKSIIAYREEHGAFKKTSDIMQVSGIKEGAFAKIKDEITVN